MGKTKTFVFALAGQLRRGVQRFAPTFAYSVALLFLSFMTLFEPFGIDMFGGMAQRLSECFMGGCVMGMAASVCVQLLHEKKPLFRFAPALLSLPFAAAAVAALHFGQNTTTWPMAYAGVLVALALLAVFLLYTAQNETALFAWLLRCAAFSGLISTVLFIGFSLCFAAFDTLLFSFQDSGRTYLLFFVLFFAVVFPALFLAQLPPARAQDEKEPQALLSLTRVYNVLMGYVALPLYGLLLVILCGYVAKIVITWHIPSGEMNWYASFALLAYLVLWLGLRAHHSAAVCRAVRWGWVLMLPVIAAQVVGIAIRVGAYGLTTARYLSLVCLAVGLFGLVLAALQKHARWLFLAAALAALLVTATPLNAVNVPYWEQSARLRTVLLQNGMYNKQTGAITPAKTPPSQEDKDAIISGYDALRWDAPEPCNDAFLQMAAGDGVRFEERYGFAYSGSGPVYSFSIYTSETSEKSMDIADYNRIYLKGGQRAYIAHAENDFVLKIPMDDGKEVSVPMRAYLEQLKKTYGTEDATISAADADIAVSDTLTLRCRNMEVTYLSGELESARVEAWLLEK